MTNLDLEIYDCTLREGEQMHGVHFTISDRIRIAKALDEAGVDYIELGWPVNTEVLEAFKQAKSLGLRSKIVAFGSTSINRNVREDKNLEALLESKADYVCIFGKSSLQHVHNQLRISPEENLEKIRDSIKLLKDAGREVFYDAEHYFDAFKANKEYAIHTALAARDAGA